MTTACTHYAGSITQSKPFSTRCTLDKYHCWIMAMFINIASAGQQCLLCVTAGFNHGQQARQTCLRYVSAGKWPSVRARSNAYRVSSMAMSSAWHSKACWQRGSAATMAVSGSTSPATHVNCCVCCKGKQHGMQGIVMGYAFCLALHGSLRLSHLQPIRDASQQVSAHAARAA